MSTYAVISRSSAEQRRAEQAELEDRAVEFVRRRGELMATEVAASFLRAAGRRGVSRAVGLLNRLWNEGRLESVLKVNPLSGQRARYYRVPGGGA